ncbi:MAG TPA: IS200/IS605 family transposase [Oceanipulchritudo sp.]|nr:IS200/IS605 family transposase [Oceanipulchritudo sp.]
MRRPKRNARKWGFLQIEDNSFTPESASMSYISSYLHCVFSTKDRLPLITPEIRPRLWSYMGGIARRNGMRAIEIGGVADHMHLILSMPATLPISKAMQLIKGGSSHWVHDTFPEARLFAWQKEYGAFSVGAPEMDTLVRYIRSQEEHHRKVSFKEEFIAFLDDNGVPYDERFLWR